MSGKSFYRSIDLINAVTKNLKVHELIKKKDRVLVSVSGGQDSLCLVFLLNQLSDQMELHLVFFWCHHLWQIDSFSLMKQIAKLSFLFQFASCFAIPFASIPSELAARNWRHQSSYRVSFFYNYDKIGLAHSANDKIETVFLNLIRGTGLTGLSPLRWMQDSSGKSTQEHRSCFSLFFVSKFYWSFLFAAEAYLNTYATHTRKESWIPEWCTEFDLSDGNLPMRGWNTTRKNSASFFFTFSLIDALYKCPFTATRVMNRFSCIPFQHIQKHTIFFSPTLHLLHNSPIPPPAAPSSYQASLVCLAYPLGQQTVGYAGARRMANKAKMVQKKLGKPSFISQDSTVMAYHLFVTDGSSEAESINCFFSFVSVLASHYLLEYMDVQQFFDSIFFWLQNRKKRATSLNNGKLKCVTLQHWPAIGHQSYTKKNFFSFNYLANSLSLKSVQDFYTIKSSAFGAFSYSTCSTCSVFSLLFLKRISLHKYTQAIWKRNKNKTTLKPKKENKAKKWFYSSSSTFFKNC